MVCNAPKGNKRSWPIRGSFVHCKDHGESRERGGRERSLQDLKGKKVDNLLCTSF